VGKGIVSSELAEYGTNCCGFEMNTLRRLSLLHNDGERVLSKVTILVGGGPKIALISGSYSPTSEVRKGELG